MHQSSVRKANAAAAKRVSKGAARLVKGGPAAQDAKDAAAWGTSRSSSTFPLPPSTAKAPMTDNHSFTSAPNSIGGFAPPSPISPPWMRPQASDPASWIYMQAEHDILPYINIVSGTSIETATVQESLWKTKLERLQKRHPAASRKLSQLKQQNKPDKFSPTVDSESISSNTRLKPWKSSNQQSNKNNSCTQPHDRECLQSVLQNFSLPKNEKTESQKNKASNPIQVSSTFYSSPDGPRISCLTSNMTQVHEDCISSSWETPRGGPLGEILTNSKNTEDLTKKCESRSYGWLLNLEDHEM